MLLRAEGGDAVVAIGQASHAWLAGQLARAWGNERFPPPAPREEVCLAAVQHDIGMAEWDLAPALRPETGLPRQFFELDRRTHLALWTAAPRRLLTQSVWAALLTSLHGTGLYERFAPPTDDPALTHYLEDQRALQADLAARLGATPEQLARNQALLAAWDDLSLALCMRRCPHDVGNVPTSRAPVVVRLEDRGDHHTLDPWPMTEEQVELRVEGRRLAGRFDDAERLRVALEDAPLVTLRFTLRAAGT